ncbi:hypothetical protein F5890DRAFT_1271424 [Lentinula detonsa]|uniref:Uncharacterized protein n=1 Tax=Lentinula detonsa TaxID=2804962 RepID=A0AA38Q0G8_9AGAR|nr:hypothetical protein F5890DRAFT_1271424 [Lentinula detonsa]
MNSHSLSCPPDAGTSLYSKNDPLTSCNTTNGKLATDMDHCPISRQQSHAELPLKLESTILKPDDVNTSKNTLESPPRRFSYVSNWRRNITPLKIGPPPSSPFGVSFPTSPVAVISPDQLRITSLPPYDPRMVSMLAGASASESFEQSIVNEPTHFNDLYDAELEQMIDEIETSSASSSTLSVTVYIPPVEPSRTADRSPRKTFPSLIRWFPTRVKYSFLSNAAKIFRH